MDTTKGTDTRTSDQAPTVGTSSTRQTSLAGTTRRFPKGRALFQRALKVIPTGIPGHLGPVESQFIPVDAYPFYAERAAGTRFWDVDGNEFIDYMCAYGPNVLGYNHPVVEKAVARQAQLGNCMALPSARQVELAELLVDTITIADWAVFMKNGNDATNLAIMTARAATGRKKVVLVKGGYHGVAPWTQKAGKPGITSEDVANNLYVEWNRIDQLRRLIEEYADEIACFMATPYHHPVFQDNELPEPGYWAEVEHLCRTNGIVLAIDDVRAGFRLALGGSADHFGFTPDLACYCKAIANGYNISALVGRDDLRSAVSDVFFTGSYWSSAVPMAAAIATITELKRIDGPALMHKHGTLLTDGLRAAARDAGLDLRVTGMPAMFYMRITNDDSLMMTQEFTAECARRGVFFTSHHNHFVNCSVGEADIATTVEIAHDAFRTVAAAHPEVAGR